MLAGRSGLSPVMVGRTAELEGLVRLLAGATAPTVALIGGEAGIGKTRLVQEMLDRLAQDTIVLTGQADPGALGRPFELLLDAVGDRGLTDQQSGLVALITDQRRPPEERVRSAFALVHSLAAGRPAVLVFDDLHWADSESVALFDRLAEPDGGRLLLVGTYRPDSLSRRHPAADLMPRLERRHSVTHVRLERLRAADVSAFLTAIYGQVPSFRVVEALHARTGGNPFFLEEILNAAGDADLDDLCASPLPWSLAEAVRAQLDDLDPEARRIVEAASVLGRKVTFDLLATVTRCTEDELIAVLRDLVHRGLMVEAENDVFSFRHALAREAIEGDLLGRERRRLHQAALEALHDTGSVDVAAIARHAHGARRTAELLAAARLGSTESLAVGSSYQALQLAELGLSEAEDDLELLSVAARAAWLAGLIDDAQDHASHWLAVARGAGDVQAEAAALRLAVRLHWEAGELHQMDAAAEAVRTIVSRLDREEDRAWSMAVMAQAHMLRGRADEAVEWADQALALSDRLGLDNVRLAALAEKGSVLITRPPDRDEGARLLAEVADEAEARGDYVIVARALHNIVRSDVRRPEPGQTRAMLERMRAAAERAGFDSLARAAYAQGLADLADWEGDLAGALAAIEAGRRDDRGYLQSGKGNWYQLHEAGLALETGDIARAEALRRELKPHVPGRAVWFHGLSLHIAARRGDLDEARVELEGMLDTARDGNLSAQLVHDVASAAIGAGIGASELRPLLDALRADAKGYVADDNPWWSLLEAQLLEADGRYDEAVGLYCDAAERGSGDLFPACRGTARVGAARCCIALGRLDEARTEAQAAAPLLARWGGWRVEELRAVQRRLGLGARIEGPEVLTPREREVAALLAEGVSNAELAERLFISPRTAAVHVSNILAKLGMASRAEVAAWAVREGL
jgi:DNA-binding CsgD family transcriptional regulator